MKGLKVLVISLGALIMIGLGLLGYGVYQKAADPDTALLTPDAKAPWPDAKPPWKEYHKGWKPPEPFGDKDIVLPAGCRVEKVISTRGRRLFLQVGPSGPLCERIVVVDAAKGTVLGTLKIKTGP